MSVGTRDVAGQTEQACERGGIGGTKVQRIEWVIGRRRRIISQRRKPQKQWRRHQRKRQCRQATEVVAAQRNEIGGRVSPGEGTGGQRSKTSKWGGRGDLGWWLGGLMGGGGRLVRRRRQQRRKCSRPRRRRSAAEANLQTRYVCR